jgi:tetratricopeptide (TPR) repeat protein
MKIIKNTIILTLIILVSLSIYFGSYKSFVKARRYIYSAQKARMVHTTGEFEQAYKEVLDYKAPILDTETIKFIGSDVLNAMQQDGQSEDVSRELARFVEEWSYKDDVLHLLNMGSIYLTMWRKYEDEEYLKKAEEYYRIIHKIAPKLPQPIYNLLVIYRTTGDEVGAYEMAEKIIKYWPQDTRVSSSEKEK